MKIYNGWVLLIGNQEVVIIGSLNVRGTTTYILKNVIGDVKSSIKRDKLIKCMQSNEILYVKSVSI